MFPPVQLDPHSPIPLYRQLSDSIGGAIKLQKLHHGFRLPPTRELAGQLGLNRTTVSAAYALLEADGLIQGHVGRGSFVRFEAKLQPLSSKISFASSRPAEDQFPMEDFQATCREVLASASASSILQLGSPFGYRPLREYLLAEATRDGSAGPEDDILITSGCQQALDLVQRVLAPDGTAVAIEDPVYHGLKNVFSRGQHPVLAVRVGNEGIDIPSLERIVAQSAPALVVVTPTFQNPTGTTMPVAARQELAAMARAHAFTLVENDIYSPLRYRGEPLPTIRALAPAQPGVILRSFSKIAFPGLRVGWIIGPRRTIAAIAEARQWCDLHTDQLSQAILLRFAESGRLASHLERVRASGAERLQTTQAACRRYLPEHSQTTTPDGGLSLWVSLPAEIDSTDCLAAAERAGVNYLPGRHFAVARIESNTLRLSFGALHLKQIEEGVRRLGEVFGSALQRSAIMQADPAAALV